MEIVISDLTQSVSPINQWATINQPPPEARQRRRQVVSGAKNLSDLGDTQDAELNIREKNVL